MQRAASAVQVGMGQIGEACLKHSARSDTRVTVILAWNEPREHFGAVEKNFVATGSDFAHAALKAG